MPSSPPSRRTAKRSDRRQSGVPPRYASATALKHTAVASSTLTSVSSRIAAWPTRNAPSSPSSTPVSLVVQSSCSGATDAVISTETICTGRIRPTTLRMSVRQWAMKSLMPASRISPMPSGRS
jgi:hypothetical protein